MVEILSIGQASPLSRIVSTDSLILLLELITNATNFQQEEKTFDEAARIKKRARFSLFYSVICRLKLLTIFIYYGEV